MRKLHVFGCSNTYGYGITDEDWSKNEEKGFRASPSKHSWAAKLAESINFQLVNHAVPGSSNHGIRNQIKKAIDPAFPYLDTSYHPKSIRESVPLLMPNSSDLAVILFTYWNRGVYYKENGELEQIGGGNTDSECKLLWRKRTKYYFKLYNTRHLAQISLYDIEHCYLYLKSLGIPFMGMFLNSIPDIFIPTVIEQMVRDAADSVEEVVNCFPIEDRFGSDNTHWSIPVHIEIAKFAEKRLQPLMTLS